MKKKTSVWNGWSPQKPHPRFDPNKWIECACGCGTKIHPIDLHGVTRSYSKGHHNRKDPKDVKTEILTVTLTKGDKEGLRKLAVDKSRELGKPVTMNQLITLAIREYGVVAVEGEAA